MHTLPTVNVSAHESTIICKVRWCKIGCCARCCKMLRLASSGFCRQRHQRPLRRSLASAASALALLADFWVKDFGTLGALIRDAFLWMHSNTFQWDVSTLAISFCLFHSASTVFPLGRRTCSTSVCSQPAECWFQAQLGNRLKLIAHACSPQILQHHQDIRGCTIAVHALGKLFSGREALVYQ